MKSPTEMSPTGRRFTGKNPSCTGGRRAGRIFWKRGDSIMGHRHGSQQRFLILIHLSTLAGSGSVICTSRLNDAWMHSCRIPLAWCTLVAKRSRNNFAISSEICSIFAEKSQRKCCKL